MTATEQKPAEADVRPLTPHEMALHSVYAQLHAMRAQIDGLLATVAMLKGGGEGTPALLKRMAEQQRRQRPSTEREAQFFGKQQATEEQTSAA